MTEREIARKFKQSQPPVPQGFETRHDFLLWKLTENAGGEVVVKKKLSVGLVFAIVLVLVAATALAVAIVSWHQNAEKIAQMEAEQGYYSDWSADSRVALVQYMVESGILTSNERIERLLNGNLDAEAASQLATEIITEWGGYREDAISLISILESVWGSYPYEWSQEDLAWYTNTLEANGQKPEERYFIPEGEILSKEQAIALAIEYVKPLVDYPQEVWDGYTISAVFESRSYSDSDDPYWKVVFLPPTRWTTRTYIPAVTIDPRTGEIYSDEYTDTPEQALAYYYADIDSAEPTYWMRFMTHEERVEAQDKGLGSAGLAIPDPSCISEDEALLIAKNAYIEKRGYTEEQLAKLTPYAFFWGDYGGGRAAWVVRYYDETVRLPDMNSVLDISMYADTGKIISQYPE
jgi:hypothetical protein